MVWDSSDHSDYRVVDYTGWKNLLNFLVRRRLTFGASLGSRARYDEYSAVWLHFSVDLVVHFGGSDIE